MRKQTEALKMAIEAIEFQAFGKYKQEVVAKLKEALAEAEKQEPVAWIGLDETERNNIIKELSGWDTDADNNDVAVFVELELKRKNTHPNQELLNEYWEMGYNQCLETNKKFPIPATWQSLSDDEIGKVLDDLDIGAVHTDWMINFAHAIESKLKEKND